MATLSAINADAVGVPIKTRDAAGGLHDISAHEPIGFLRLGECSFLAPAPLRVPDFHTDPDNPPQPAHVILNGLGLRISMEGNDVIRDTLLEPPLQPHSAVGIGEGVD